MCSRTPEARGFILMVAVSQVDEAFARASLEERIGRPGRVTHPRGPGSQAPAWEPTSAKLRFADRRGSWSFPSRAFPSWSLRTRRITTFHSPGPRQTWQLRGEYPCLIRAEAKSRPPQAVAPWEASVRRRGDVVIPASRELRGPHASAPEVPNPRAARGAIREPRHPAAPRARQAHRRRSPTTRARP